MYIFENQTISEVYETPLEWKPNVTIFKCNLGNLKAA